VINGTNERKSVDSVLILHLLDLPACLKVTAYCSEQDADMEALESASYVSDKGDLVNGLHNDPANIIPHPPLGNDETMGSGIRTLMAFRHESLPLWGVQFHPESICTEYGVRMMSNFSKLTLDWMAKVCILIILNIGFIEHIWFYSTSFNRLGKS
jgi:para-aminobenzoate synthetase